MAHEAEHAAADGGHGEGAHQEGGKSGHHGKGHHGRGHGDDHGGGGGHGGSWIITYCDMITLLIACFICIITFASSEKEKYSKKRDSLLFGTGGVGIAGPMAEALELDSVVDRQRPLAARLGTQGSEVLPLHDSPGMDAAAEVIRQLEAPIPGTMQDSYSMQLPMRLLLGPDNKITEVGAGILRSVADNVRHLPYDLYFQVDDAANLGKAVKLTAFLGTQESIPAGRLGIGLRNTGTATEGSVWLFFARQR